jgi:hypothetical protein
VDISSGNEAAGDSHIPDYGILSGMIIKQCFLAFIACAALLPASLAADTVWKRENSPILLKSDLRIKQNETLTIEEGVTVRLGPGVSLVINGTIKAQGSKAGMIVFEPLVPGKKWKEIGLDHITAEGSVISFCKLNGGGEFAKYTGALSISNSSVPILVDHCQFADWYPHNKAIWGYKSSGVSIKSCSFSPAPTDSECIRAIESPWTIESCFFPARSGYNDAVDLEDCKRPGAVPIIRYCLFDGTEDDELDLDRCDADVVKCLFRNAGKGKLDKTYGVTEKKETSGTIRYFEEASGIAADQGSEVRVGECLFIGNMHGLDFKNSSRLKLDNSVIADCVVGVWCYINRQFKGFGPGYAAGEENAFANVKTPVFLQDGAKSDLKYDVKELDTAALMEKFSGETGLR